MYVFGKNGEPIKGINFEKSYVTHKDYTDTCDILESNLITDDDGKVMIGELKNISDVRLEARDPAY